MSEPAVGAFDPSGATTPVTAGGLLRQARQARGLHIAALATSIKVSPQKLELLETDRFDELPGATFTRALAQTVCRSLKIDPAPVMALLPQAVGHGLEQMSRGLNEPFRDRPGRREPDDLQFIKNPVVLGAIALGLLALGVYLVPSRWIGTHPDVPAGAVTGSGAASAVDPTMPAAARSGEIPPVPSPASAPVPTVVDAGKSEAVVETVFSAPPAGVPASAASASAPTAAGALQLRVSAESWVEVLDRRGVSLLSRMLQPGETVGLVGVSPLRVKIGNAAATEVTYKGEAIDLIPVTTRENVAKLELR